ncbi:Heavy metal RND efflux outer membrane protein, CzcC family [hydrothermal vent metagenome]|uniref:Heavy metal RND efflux outer membrane protein, CzcC family n=1 Tax=hydrothermal vent metagenome TaxID=652676 RepID=A0A3B1AQ59_9ZZZZ
MNKTIKIAVMLLSVPLCTNLIASETKAKHTLSVLPLSDQAAPQKLTQFINGIIKEHPRLLEERARLAAAQANVRAADQAIYNPELEIDSEKTDINTSYLQLSQTIDIGDKQGAKTSVAQAELIQANAEYEMSKQQLAYDLLNALANQYTKNEIYKLIQQNLMLMKDFANISERRHRAGDLSQVELNLARLAYSEAIITRTQAAADAASSKEQLRVLLGHVPDNIPLLPKNLPLAKLPHDKDKFISNLPAVHLEQAKVTSARKNVDLRQSEKSWDPTISLRGGKEDTQSLAGITLSIPLNIRNSFSAEVDVAKQQFIQAEFRAQQAFREQRAIVLTSTQRYSLLQQAWLTWSKNGDSSIQQQLKLIKRLWQVGDMSTTDYLVQLKQAIDTQTAGLELRGKFWQSAFEWMNTTASIINWLNINISESSK